MPLYLDVKVVPQAGKIRWALGSCGELKCHLLSAPEKNKANEELIALLAKALRLPKNSITIELGATSRSKRIKIDADISLDIICQALGIERQLSI